MNESHFIGMVEAAEKWGAVSMDIPEVQLWMAREKWGAVGG